MIGSIPMLHHQHGGDGTEEAGDRADRQVDVPDHDDEQHPEGHHEDVAVLQEDVRHVERLEHHAIGRDLEEGDDDQERDEHAGAAQAAEPRQQGVERALLGRGGGKAFRRRAHRTTSSTPARLSRMMAFMIDSWVASDAGISAAIRPAAMT